MIKVFTDGSVSRPYEGRSPGGWAYSFSVDGKVINKFGSYLNTTNNRMELTAAIKALLKLQALGYVGYDITIISDSQYVIYGASRYMPGWKRNGRLYNRNSSLKNRDLWLKVDELSKVLQVQWIWIRGHNGHEHNERCDRLAGLGSLRALSIEKRLALL